MIILILSSSSECHYCVILSQCMFERIQNIDVKCTVFEYSTNIEQMSLLVPVSVHHHLVLSSSSSPPPPCYCSVIIIVITVMIHTLT